MSVRWYWHLFSKARPLPVTVHALRDHRFYWRCICGLQIGPWFIGVIRGAAQEETR